MLESGKGIDNRTIIVQWECWQQRNKGYPGKNKPQHWACPVKHWVILPYFPPVLVIYLQCLSCKHTCSSVLLNGQMLTNLQTLLKNVPITGECSARKTFNYCSIKMLKIYLSCSSSFITPENWFLIQRIKTFLGFQFVVFFHCFTFKKNYP